MSGGVVQALTSLSAAHPYVWGKTLQKTHFLCIKKRHLQYLITFTTEYTVVLFITKMQVIIAIASELVNCLPNTYIKG